MRHLLIWAILGATIMTLSPDGMRIGSYDPTTGSIMTIGPGGMELGSVDKTTGDIFIFTPKGITEGGVSGWYSTDPSRRWDMEDGD